MLLAWLQWTKGLQKAVSKRLSLDTDPGMGSPEQDELLGPPDDGTLDRRLGTLSEVYFGILGARSQYAVGMVAVDEGPAEGGEQAAFARY